MLSRHNRTNVYSKRYKIFFPKEKCLKPYVTLTITCSIMQYFTRDRCTLEKWFTNFFCKQNSSKYFRLSGYMASVTMTHLCHHSTTVAIKHMAAWLCHSEVFIQPDHVPQCANYVPRNPCPHAPGTTDKNVQSSTVHDGNTEDKVH